ncbi:MAG: ATP-binding cassette domain-containing protein, partial [Thermomonas sp.]
MIVAEQLRKTFPGKGKDKSRVIAVDNVGFTARDGEITGLLGPNGAGKTTTLRMLYTLMTPETGRVLVDGIDVATDPNRVRRSLGVLPDARGVYKRLTARENIAYFGELHGMPANLIAERTAKLASALQMEDFLDRVTEGFSQGQRTKTAIARALIHDPKNVILDEPTNGLDVMTTRGLRAFLMELRAEGRCVIFSSHIMQEVAALCDRIVVIAQGKVAAQG